MDISELAQRAIDDLVRRAAGLPRATRMEVGQDQPRWRDQRGSPRPDREMAARRALGGATFPATREELLAGAEAWLGRDRGGARVLLATLPEGRYLSADEAWAAIRGAAEPPQAPLGQP